jgi:recombinational DNA repair protein RecT
MAKQPEKFSLVAAQKTLPELLKTAAASQDIIRSTATQIARIAGADDKFAQSFGISTAAYFTSKAGQNIAGCKPETILGALVELARYRLTLDAAAANAYLVPYGMACQLQLGYRGYETLVRRRFPQFYAVLDYVLPSELATLKIHNRIENGKNISSLTHELNTADRLQAAPKWLGENAAAMYCVAYLREGEVLQISTMSRAEVEGLRRMSAMQKGEKPAGTWDAHYIAMWKAKIMRRVCKGLFTSDEGFGLPDEYIHTLTNDAGETDSVAIDYEEVPQGADTDGAAIVTGFLEAIRTAPTQDALNAVVARIQKTFGKGTAPAEIGVAYRARVKNLEGAANV